MQPHLTTRDISDTLKKEYYPAMKSIQITPLVKYVELEDEEGTFGLMIHQTSNPQVVEIHNERDFQKWYEEFTK